MIMKKTLSLLLAVIMIAMTFTVFPITANAVDVDAAGTAEGTLIPVYTKEDLTNACDTINKKGGTYTISLSGDIVGGQVEVTNPDAVVTVIGNGTISATQSAVYVSGGAKVILGDGNSELTLTSADNNDTPGIVHVLKDSSCTMKNQVTLRDHDGQNYLGGGVTVDGGTFVMDGGTITNCSIAGTEQDDNGGSVCYGGGVAVFNSGTFTMNGGTITKCNVTTDYSNSGDYNQISGIGGGVFVTSGSVFNMNGGTISNCTASLYGGGVAVVSANINGNFKSIVNINSGTISDNTAAGGAGVFASGFLYAKAVPIATNAELAGSTSTGSSGSTDALHGEAPSDPGLYIGKRSSTDSILIENNHANGTYVKNAERKYANGLGGGILIANIGTYTSQIYDAEISANNADIGAGVAVFHHKTQTHIDNCTITGNTAVKNGGGFAAIRNKDDGESTFGYSTIKNTTITGNKSGDRGAGVYYDEESKLYISGADIIQNNKYNGKLNNLNVLSLEKPVYVDGDLTGSQIGLSDPTLWDDGKEDYDAKAVSTEYLTSGYKANNPGVHPSEYFTSDHETWIVERSAKTTTTVEDDSLKARRKYTVERYPIISYPNTYAGHKGQFAIIEIQNDLTKISNNNELKSAIFEELNNYFNNSNYTFVDSSIINQYVTWLRYDYYPKVTSDNPLKYIRIEKKNNEEVTVTYYPNNDKNSESSITNRRYGGSVAYIASTTNQKAYANPGELVLQISSPGDSSINNVNNNFVFSTDSTTGSFDYIDLDPPKIPNYPDVFYEYDEYGDIKAKLVPTGYSPVKPQIEVESGTDDEVRLVRKKPDYHINNDVIDDQYGNNDIFTSHVEDATGKAVKVGETIDRFYLIPKVVPTQQNSCPYIFKGWYYDQNNENDTRPVDFGNDKYAKDIYAHWIKVEDVAKDEKDESILPDGYNGKYGGFDLAGVNIRKEMRDYNFDDVPKTPGGLRFITSLSMDVVNQINAIQPNNIEYGYVAATHKGWIDYHCDGVANGSDEKLKYVSETANGIDTSSAKATNENYFGFAKNIDCTSRYSNKNGVVELDHQNFGNYLLYSFVVTYEDAGSNKDKDVLARPYIRYKDANGSERVAYSDYRGTNVIGGCYTSYNYVVKNMMPSGN